MCGRRRACNPGAGTRRTKRMFRPPPRCDGAGARGQGSACNPDVRRCTPYQKTRMKKGGWNPPYISERAGTPNARAIPTYVGTRPTYARGIIGKGG